MPNNDNLIKSYLFLKDAEINKKIFSLIELQNFTGWSKSTTKTYLSKKWDKYVFKHNHGYEAIGISEMSQEEYIRSMSQARKHYEDFSKPRLSPLVEGLVRKAKESALLALDIYNRPATIFKSEGFIVMVIIAWTSLLHAIFARKNIEYYYKEKDGSYKIIDGQKKAWELSTSLKRFYKNDNLSVVKNLTFLIKLRNIIEHHYLPTIDEEVLGECQACILNFDELIVNEFTEYYAIKDYLKIPLQTSNIRTSKQIEIQKKFQGKQYDNVKKFIQTYRRSISDEMFNDPQFSFRVHLVPKAISNKNNPDLAIEFVKYDSSKPEAFKDIEERIAMVKERKVSVSNLNKFKPGQVVKEVNKRVNKKFSMNTHTKAWKFYKVRPQEKTHVGCNTDFCTFDEPHRDFVYSKNWIEFLVKKINDEEEYSKLLNYK